MQDWMHCNGKEKRVRYAGSPLVQVVFYLVDVTDDFGPWKILQLSLVHIQNLVRHLKVVLVCWRAVQLDFPIPALHQDYHISVQLHHLL